MCKAKYCDEKHAKHYCRICEDTDSDHRSRHCSLGTTIFHGTKMEYAQAIQKNGFKASTLGRIGSGVYFTLDFDEAKNIAKYKFNGSNPVVIECKAQVTYDKFNKGDSQEEMIRKLNQWFQFCKSVAKSGMHPQWANNHQFKQICVKNAKAIYIGRIHKV